ncbi:cytochrome C [Rhodanobacter lindaniclasticus]
MSKPHVRVYLDDATQPVIDQELPTALTLDTRMLPTVAPAGHSRRGSERCGGCGGDSVPRAERPGHPGLGPAPRATRRGTLHLTVDAFSTDDPFDPRRAEARSSIPVWVWVLSLFVVAWAVFYAARMWEVPAPYANTPTYMPPPASPPAPPPHR